MRNNKTPDPNVVFPVGKIEMLFVSPDYFGKGVGRQLAELAISKHEVQYVDVNEQNPQAIVFYEHIGFEVFEQLY